MGAESGSSLGLSKLTVVNSVAVDEASPDQYGVDWI